MSQNDYTIINQGFPAFRSDLNSALQAIATNNSGDTAPSTTFANMWWYDDANNILYIRNEDNDAWIKFAELDQVNDKFVLSGTLQLDDGTVSAPALTFNSDTNMGLYRGGTDILKFVTAGADRLTIDASGLTQLRSTGIGAGSPVLQVIDDGTTILNVRAEDGNISFPVAGAGIYLGVTAGDANHLLNYYEEGTWTATLGGASANPSTPVTVAGVFTKIGDVVFASANFTNVNVSGISGAVRITGLPFAGSPSGIMSGTVTGHTIFSFVTGDYSNLAPQVNGSGLSFYLTGSNTAWSEPQSISGTSNWLYFSVTYKT
jgi:hypothetical protein